MAQQILSIVSTVFGVCALTFFLIGCIGFSSTQTTIKHIAWITIDDNGFEVWFGLAKLYYQVNGQDGLTAYNNCGSDYCDDCEKDGLSAFGLLIVSTVFALVSAALSGALSASFSAGLQMGNIAASFVSASLALVGFGLFMGNCYSKVDDSVDADLEWGPGSILVCLGVIMMYLVTVMQLAAMMVGPAVK